MLSQGQDYGLLADKDKSYERHTNEKKLADMPFQLRMTRSGNRSISVDIID